MGDQVVRLASDDAEKLATLPRSLEHGAGHIAPPLGPRQFLAAAPLAIIIMGHTFRRAHDLPDVEQRHTREGTEFPVRFRIHLHVLEVEADVMVDVDEFVHHVFGAKGARLTADEFGDLCERIGPKHGIQRRSVDVADNAAQLIVFAHVTYPTSGFLGMASSLSPASRALSSLFRLIRPWAATAASAAPLQASA